MKNIKLIFGFLFLLTITLSCSVEGIDEDTSFVNSVKAPSNVVAFYNITQDNTGKVTITPNGEGAISYEIYYGDTTTTPVTVLQGKNTSHIYREGTYTVKIVATGITGLKTEATQSLIVSFRAPENLVVVITNDNAISKKVNVTANADYATMFDVYFGEPGNDVPVSANIGETASYVYQQVGSHKIKVVAKSGAIKTTNHEEDFVVTAIMAPTVSAPTPPSRAAGNVVSIFSDSYSNIGVSEWNPGWGQTTVLTAATIGSNNMLQYNLLNYTGIVTDYSNATNLSSMEFVHFDYWTPDATTLGFKIVNTASGYADGDSRKESQVNLSSITLNNWVSVDIPLSDFTTNRSAITQMLFSSSGASVFIDNLYFYRAVPTSPTTNAPTPSVAASGVVSIFSDAYNNINVSELNPNWGQSTALSEVLIGSNKILKYSDLNFTGIVTDYVNPTNLSSKTKVHFDYWTPDATRLAFKIVNTASGYANGDSRKESLVSLSSVTTGSWVSVDISLSDFTTDKSGITQMLFESSGGTVFIDNLYFY